jgi:Fe-S-cluster containining protein
VPLTHFDVARLVRATHREPQTLVEWLSPAEIDMAGEPEAFVLLKEGRRLMTLPHRDGGCTWLDAQDLCSVYAARPSTCAAYPYTLHERGSERVLTVLGDSPCVLSREGEVNAATQNIQGSENEDLVSTAGRRKAAEQVDWELNAFVELVATWNRRQRRRRFAGRPPLGSRDFVAFSLTKAQLNS